MTYSTISGDSWDMISFKAYGSERYVPELIAANPQFVATFIFDAGIELELPDLETKTNSILPWKT